MDTFPKLQKYKDQQELTTIRLGMASDRYLNRMNVTEEIKRLYDPEYRSCAVIVDAQQPDHPIVFATSMFMEVTGYDRDYVIGRNCRFLQGPDTDDDAVAQVRHALREAKPVTVALINYRKDGLRFINTMRVTPFFDLTGQIQFFGGYQAFTPIH